MTSPRDTADNDGGYDPAGDPSRFLRTEKIPTYSGKAPVSAEPFERAEPGHSDRVFAGASLPKQARRQQQTKRVIP